MSWTDALSCSGTALWNSGLFQNSRVDTYPGNPHKQCCFRRPGTQRHQGQVWKGSTAGYTHRILLSLASPFRMRTPRPHGTANRSSEVNLGLRIRACHPRPPIAETRTSSNPTQPHGHHPRPTSSPDPHPCRRCPAPATMLCALPRVELSPAASTASTAVPVAPAVAIPAAPAVPVRIPVAAAIGVPVARTVRVASTSAVPLRVAPAALRRAPAAVAGTAALRGLLSRALAVALRQVVALGGLRPRAAAAAGGGRAARARARRGPLLRGARLRCRAHCTTREEETKAVKYQAQLSELAAGRAEERGQKRQAATGHSAAIPRRDVDRRHGFELQRWAGGRRAGARARRPRAPSGRPRRRRETSSSAARTRRT